MDEQHALLKAIQASPAEDAVRLAYADWLEEHGDECDRARAEFIRVQCELARRWPNWEGIPADDSLARGGDYDMLRRRERELFLAYAFDWLSGYAGMTELPARHAPCNVRCGVGPETHVFEYVFRRGFPEMLLPMIPNQPPVWVSLPFPLSPETINALRRQSEPMPTPI